MADQWAASSFGCYGSQISQVTPSIDRLAVEGTRFDRCYTSTPVCAPNRACIFTGRSPSIHGLLFNNFHLRSDPPSFTHVLRDAGYRTRGVGKFHFTPMHREPPDDLSHLGFDEVVVTEDPKWGRWIDWIEEQHPDYYERALAMCWPMSFVSAYGPARRNLGRQYADAVTKWIYPRIPSPAHRFYESPLPAELHQTHWITDQAIKMLERNREEQEPFFLFVSYVDPHDPWDPPKPYSSMFAPETLPAPIPREWSDGWAPNCYRSLVNEEPLWVGRFTEEEWLRLRSLFYGSCRFVDDQVGRLLRHLESAALMEDTVVIFTTDHGEMLGDHGLLMKGPFHYDSCVRVPLVIRGPDVARGAVDTELTCSLDFFPTILDLAGVSSDVPVEGRSVVGAGTPKEEVRIESNQLDRTLSTSIVTRDFWRLTVFPGEGYGELFKLDKDPFEQDNLWRDPAHERMRLDLTERLVASISRQAFPATKRNQDPAIDYEIPSFHLKEEDPGAGRTISGRG